MKIKKMISAFIGSVCVFSAFVPRFSGVIAHGADAAKGVSDEIDRGYTVTTTIKPDIRNVKISDVDLICPFCGISVNSEGEPSETVTTAVTEENTLPITTTTTAYPDSESESTESTTTTATYTEPAEIDTTTESEPIATTITTTSDLNDTTTTTSTSDWIEPTYTTTTTPTYTTTTTMTTTTTTLTTTTTTLTTTTIGTSTTVPIPDLILQCSVSCGERPGVIIISAKTQGTQRLDEIGFMNLRIMRSVDRQRWTTERTLGSVIDENAFINTIDKLEVEVAGNAYYTVSCNHYAKHDGVTERVPNMAEAVWISKADNIYTTTTTVMTTTYSTMASTTTKKSAEATTSKTTQSQVRTTTTTKRITDLKNTINKTSGVTTSGSVKTTTASSASNIKGNNQTAAVSPPTYDSGTGLAGIIAAAAVLTAALTYRRKRR